MAVSRCQDNHYIRLYTQKLCVLHIENMFSYVPKQNLTIFLHLEYFAILSLNMEILQKLNCRTQDVTFFTERSICMSHSFPHHTHMYGDDDV